MRGSWRRHGLQEDGPGEIQNIPVTAKLCVEVKSSLVEYVGLLEPSYLEQSFLLVIRCLQYFPRLR